MCHLLVHERSVPVYLKPKDCQFAVFLMLFDQVNPNRLVPTHIWNCPSWWQGHPDAHGLDSAEFRHVSSVQHLVQSVSAI